MDFIMSKQSDKNNNISKKFFEKDYSKTIPKGTAKGLAHSISEFYGDVQHVLSTQDEKRKLQEENNSLKILTEMERRFAEVERRFSEIESRISSLEMRLVKDMGENHRKMMFGIYTAIGSILFGSMGISLTIISVLS